LIGTYLKHITTAGLNRHGYAHAKQYLSAVPADGLPLQPETLMMTAQTKPGVSFRETMLAVSLLAKPIRTPAKKRANAGRDEIIRCIAR